MISDIESGIIVKFSLLVQHRESYSLQIVNKPHLESIYRSWDKRKNTNATSAFDNDFSITSEFIHDQIIPGTYKRITCERCNRAGSEELCTNCHGTGQIKTSKEQIKPCPQCSGFGFLVHKCDTCTYGLLEIYLRKIILHSELNCSSILYLSMNIHLLEMNRLE